MNIFWTGGWLVAHPLSQNPSDFQLKKRCKGKVEASLVRRFWGRFTNIPFMVRFQPLVDGWLLGKRLWRYHSKTVHSEVDVGKQIQ